MKKMMLFSVVIGVFFLSACSQTPFYHEHIMRGQVVSVNSERVKVCIAKKDGAKVEDVLNVYRVVVSGQDAAGEDLYEKKPVGKVMLTRITSEHFAIATVTEGEAQKNDIVELSR
tara:strand:- start:2988 stop:3332 length:345 start_codon:yes stop_codon:yes gene_type:complete